MSIKATPEITLDESDFRQAPFSMWSCIGRALARCVPTLLECERYEGFRTVDAKPFKIALLVGRLCSRMWKLTLVGLS
jgi:hypothetical protein